MKSGYHSSPGGACSEWYPRFVQNLMSMIHPNTTSACHARAVPLRQGRDLSAEAVAQRVAGTGTVSMHGSEGVEAAPRVLRIQQRAEGGNEQVLDPAYPAASPSYGTTLTGQLSLLVALA